MANGFGASQPGSDAAGTIANNVLSNYQNIFAVSPQGKYVSGARTILKINGELAAWAFQVSWNVRTDQDEIWGIDDWTAYELAPKRISIDGSLSGFYLPIKGSPTKIAATPTMLSFMFHKYITIEVRDSVTDAVLFHTDKAVVTNTAVESTAEQLSKLVLNWKAIGWYDEKEPEYPTGITP